MTFNRSTMRDTGPNGGGQRTKLPVYNSGIETGNKSLVMDHPMRELYISNNSMDTDLTLTVSGDSGLSLDFIVHPGGTFDERLPEFLRVDVVGSAWDWRIRSGQVT